MPDPLRRPRPRRATLVASIAMLVAAAAAVSASATAIAAPVTSDPGCVTISTASSAGPSTTPVSCGAALGAPIQVAPSSGPAPSPSGPVAGSLTDLVVVRSAPAVYPVPDGYLDTVRFAVHALDGAGHGVPVSGAAVLRRGSSVIETWALAGSSAVLEWDGRVHDHVRTGTYAVQVTARSADGAQRIARTEVRVVGGHVERRKVTVRSDVGATSVHAAMPAQVLKAFAKGPVTCRILTVARVTGVARLVFSSGGVRRPVRLRDGARTTAALRVPKGFEEVTIRHAWKRGAAHLTSLKAVWTYWTLV